MIRPDVMRGMADAGFTVSHSSVTGGADAVLPVGIEEHDLAAGADEEVRAVRQHVDARELARLCQEHLAFQWLLGGVTVNYHTLADFRVNFEQELDELLTKSVAALVHEGIVSLERTIQDGMRIRARAG